MRDPPVMVKCTKKKRLKRKFQIDQSVFTSWKKVEMKQYYKKCFTADMRYSKIYKFVKDPDEYKAVCDVILQNYELIFE